MPPDDVDEEEADYTETERCASLPSPPASAAPRPPAATSGCPLLAAAYRGRFAVS